MIIGPQKKIHFINALIALYFLVGLFLSKANSEELEIVDVKRNIPLSDTDPVYKDFYIQATNSKGLKKNLVVKALRKITVKNSSQKTLGEFNSQIGLLKIIQVEGGLAIAREYSLKSRQNDPVLDQVGFMVGDRIDLADSFTDNKSK